ncbi:PREDICTED: uncharacterized protein LOC107070629 [Polistes dominula]|uniref:Uncharacterized protein LOC107070629 n=1 Tax=Polistes dominula TaxID=743375 RepID=A0ABM1IWA7_POLDO|nr:PREDICTED: uncharacterized protein LOC107070629 [Polistes dominula]
MQVKLPWVLICIQLLLVLSAVMYMQTESTENNTKIMNKNLLEDVIFKFEPNDTSFQTSLLERRQQYAEIIKAIEKMDSYDMRFETIILLTKDIIESSQNSSTLVENYINDVPGYDLKECIIGDALFTILENTAFLGDIIFHFPDIMQIILTGNEEWMETLYSSFHFAHKMKYLFDEQTISIIYSAQKELGFKK